VRVLVGAAQGPFRAVVESAPIGNGLPSFDIVFHSAALLDRLQDRGAPPCDVVLVDFDLPDCSGLKGLPLLRAAADATPIGVVMAGASLELAKRILSQGAQAVLPRTLSLDSLVGALTLIADGHVLAISEAGAPLDGHQHAALLSERELQVLSGICEGLQNKEIAHAFEIQEVTVKMHVRAIIRKLGARNRTQAAMIARDLGIC